MSNHRTHLMVRWSALLAITSTLFSVQGCGSTETGNPPLLPEPGISFADFEFTIPPALPGQAPDPERLVGGLSNDVPAGSFVVVIPLDLLSADAVIATPDELDGFRAELPLGSNQWRVQVIAPDGSRYTPLDVGLDAAGDPLPEPSPSESCLRIPGAVATTGSPRVAEFEITNNCLDTIDIQAPLTRLGLAQTTPGGPLRLASGETLTITVELDVAVPVGGEELILWEASDGLVLFTTVFDPSPR